MNDLLDEAIGLSGWGHLRCLAHTLNLVVQDGIKQIEPLRKKVRGVVGYFHRSTKGADKFKQTQMRDKPTKTPLRLINEVATRWNSTFLMFQRVCDVQESLVKTIAVLGECANISKKEFLVMRRAIVLLKPFYEASTELSAEKVVTASKVIVMIGVLKKKLALTAGSSKGIVKAMAESMSRNLSDRYLMLEGQPMLALPTFLDPRFKNQGFTKMHRYLECKREVEAAVARIHVQHEDETSHTSPVTAVSNSSSLWDEFDRDVANAVSGRSTCSGMLEVRQYIEEAPIARSSDPLMYWQKRESAFPRLSILAKKYLSLVATSVPSERVFSTAGQLISARRSRLSTNNVQKMMFMHHNIEHFES